MEPAENQRLAVLPGLSNSIDQRPQVFERLSLNFQDLVVIKSEIFLAAGKHSLKPAKRVETG